MPNQGNDRSPTLTWPTADELGRVYRTSGKLLERFEKIDGNLRPVYEASDDGQQPTYEELGVLTWFVSAIENDLESISECVASLARVRDVACPAVR